MSLNQYTITGKKNDIDLNEIEQFVGLQTLKLKQFKINDENIKKIIDLRYLKNLILINCIIDFKTNINSNLQYLRISNCNKLDYSLLNNNLENLELENLEIVELENLLKCNNLKYLKISKCKTITDIEKIVDFTELEELRLNEIEINENIDINKMDK